MWLRHHIGSCQTVRFPSVLPTFNQALHLVACGYRDKAGRGSVVAEELGCLPAPKGEGAGISV